MAMDKEKDIHYMSLALSLAEKGHGTVSPNPMVGAVIVRDDTIVGQGYHKKSGEEHAEVIALREAGDKAKGATLYVTLEPCCHYGQTPPCTEAIRASGIRRVVAAMKDDNPLVNGGGFAYLNMSKIEVSIGILEVRARKLNEVYLKFMTTGIPFVTLKLGVTLDGKIADAHGNSQWITGEETRRYVHRMRSWSDAVMVGVETVLRDNPKLTVREVEGKSPLRVILDSHLRTPLDANVCADNHVIIATTNKYDKERCALFEKRGIEVWKCETHEGHISLSSLHKKLGGENITSVFCEGGSRLATSLLKETLIDKIIFAFGSKILGSGLSAIGDIGIESLYDALMVKDISVVTIGNDVVISGYPIYT
jgi:diaminohydroxyphosphoribosylaminopyrimidine deaminase / 5-amino-6-(5-phosphoribosylamino)uracil reductase